MSLDRELRQMLRRVDELPVPNLRPSVMSAIDRPTRGSMSAWPSRVAAMGLVVVLLIGVAWMSSSRFDGPSTVGPPTASSQESNVTQPTSDQASASIGAPSPSHEVPSPTMRDTTELTLATNPPDGGGGDALAVGRLGGTVADHVACIWIEATTTGGADPVRTALIWPHGFRALEDPLRLLAPDGRTLARVGDAVELGGGGPPIDYIPTSEQDPCQIGRVFSISVVVSVNGTHVDAAGESLRITTRQLGETGTCGVPSLDPMMLVMSDQHLRLRVNGTDWEASWPYGFKAVAGERITIVDTDGVIVLRQGDESSTVRGSVAHGRIDVCGFGEVTYP